MQILLRRGRRRSKRRRRRRSSGAVGVERDPQSWSGKHAAAAAEAAAVFRRRLGADERLSPGRPRRQRVNRQPATVNVAPGGAVSPNVSALAVVSAAEWWRPAAVAAPSPVAVAVYYETLCPCCRAFVTQQLLPTYERAPELVDLTLVPYGNAQTMNTSKGYEFVCQHGPVECQGNKIHACAVQHVRGTLRLLRLVACMISDEDDPEAAARRCGQLLGVPWRPVLRCGRGREGSLLLEAAGERTAALGSKMDGVPAIAFNGELGDQLAAINHFWDELCKRFPEPKPTKCLNSSHTASQLPETHLNGAQRRETCS